MNNENVIWAKSVILSYRYFEKICNAIDKSIEHMACNSFFNSTLWAPINSIHNVSKRIIDMSQTKLEYINLKVLTNKILENMDNKLSKVLILKYIHNLKATEVADLLKINIRTFFRKLNKALSQFGSMMNKYGYNKEKMEIKFFNDDLIGSIYKKLLQETEKNEKKVKKVALNNKVLSNKLEIENYLITKNA